ncbi:hypothetical protein C1910_12160 [Listeria ivanovii]|nr:hypothetical protein C1910_12160 [Listeria ivanovii]
MYSLRIQHEGNDILTGLYQNGVFITFICVPFLLVIARLIDFPTNTLILLRLGSTSSLLTLKFMLFSAIALVMILVITVVGFIMGELYQKPFSIYSVLFFSLVWYVNLICLLLSQELLTLLFRNVYIPFILIMISVILEGYLAEPILLHEYWITDGFGIIPDFILINGILLYGGIIGVLLICLSNRYDTVSTTTEER